MLTVPIDIWNNTIIDGHNRYQICQEHNIDFQVKELSFDSDDDAKVWIIDNQLDRRNLAPFSYIELRLKKTEILDLKKKAEENQKEHGGTAPGKSLIQNSEKVFEPINITKELSKETGYSTDTVSKAIRIVKKAPEEVKEKLRTGELSINRVYQDIKKEEKKENRINDLKEKAKQGSLIEISNGIDLRFGDFENVLSSIPDNTIALITSIIIFIYSYPDE